MFAYRSVHHTYSNSAVPTATLSAELSNRPLPSSTASTRVLSTLLFCVLVFLGLPTPTICSGTQPEGPHHTWVRSHPCPSHILLWGHLTQGKNQSPPTRSHTVCPRYFLNLISPLIPSFTQLQPVSPNTPTERTAVWLHWRKRKGMWGRE